MIIIFWTVTWKHWFPKTGRIFTCIDEKSSIEQYADFVSNMLA